MASVEQVAKDIAVGNASDLHAGYLANHHVGGYAHAALCVQ